MLQKALSAPMVTVPRAIQPSIVVSDYCSSHRLQDNIRALTEAIIFAVDHRKLRDIVHLNGVFLY